jgi:hypothetical protein
MKILIGLLALIFSSSHVLACSCMFHEGSLEEQVTSSLSSSSAVVWARAESTEDIEPYETEVWSEEKGKRKETYYQKQRTQFVAIESWKGLHGKRFFTEVEVVCCVCGYRFIEGEEYLLYLYGPNKDGYYHASTCSRTKIINSKSLEEMEILRKIGLTNQAKRPL